MLNSAASTSLLLAASALLLFGCGKSEWHHALAKIPVNGPTISGAGATFPAVLYARWAEAYIDASGVALSYKAIGSSAGIEQIQGQAVDFGASDKPLKLDDLDKDGLFQFPTVLGGVVPVMNLPGVPPGQVKLTGPLLAGIFLGSVKTWNDPKLAALNPRVTLPNLPVTVVHRSDGSGTSFLFTAFLTAQSPAWAQKEGASDSVEWPTGVGGRGNDGVAALVEQKPGAIGYVEFAYATQNKMTYADLQNRDGAFVAPAAQTFAAAAVGADWAKAPGNYLLLIDQPGAQSWPITGATFILLHRRQANPIRGRKVLSFFDWAYKNGDADAKELDYAPLPERVKDLVRKQWASTIKGPDGTPIFAGS